MKILFQIVLVYALSSLVGCISHSNIVKLSDTRTEQDAFTVTTRDTTIVDAVKNNPGDRDNGVIYPSSRSLKIESYSTQYDSIVERKYPSLIRIGLFEGIGLIGTSKSEVGLGSGMFGIMGFFDESMWLQGGNNRNAIFTGGIYRIGIIESRLRWFHDAKDWTIGTSIVETIIHEGNFTTALTSVAPVYFRKRYYLKETIPYITITPTIGLGLFPSQYLNLSTSLDVGSMGGLNFRAYLGIAGGGYLFHKSPTSYTFPYAGIGVSVLDFINRVPELYTEWKDHEHSSWNIGLLQLSVVYSGADAAFLKSSKPSASPLKGIIARVAPVSIALPLLDYRLYAGTSLLNFVAIGQNQFGFGILPIRVGYWHPITENELSVEPFMEYNYYPSSFVHLGGKLNLNTSFMADLLGSVFLQAGWVNGSVVTGIVSDLADELGVSTSFSGAYFGIGIGINDKIFAAKELRYNK